VARASHASDGLAVAQRFDLMNRGRRELELDLKQPPALEQALGLVERADVLIEGFRPGTMERLGLGPDACLARNPALIYARMTGWGQSGPLASTAGHDINYIALSGALHGIGRRGSAPVPPLNLVGDLGGGALFLVAGILAALFERARSGAGQVVDASMVEGSALLMTPFFGLLAAGEWRDRHGENSLDSGAHFYDVYETLDGLHVAVGAVEDRFYRELMGHLGLAAEEAGARFDRATWAERKREVAAAIRSKTRAQWVTLFENSDACFTPVLSMRDAPRHPHNCSRGTFIEVDGVVQPAPAPRFSRTPASVPHPPGRCLATVDAVLRDWERRVPPAAGRTSGRP
jgi:alpha-methylacyl-CoA racemase